MRSDSIGRKGNAILDGLLIVVALTIFAIIGIVGYHIFGEINDDIQAQPEIKKETKDLSQGLYDRTDNTIDAAILVIMLLFWIMAIVSVFFLDTHPIFFVISLILLVVVMIVAGYLANAFEEVATEIDPTFAATFPITNFIFGHLIETIAMIGISMLIAYFAKSRGD